MTIHESWIPYIPQNAESSIYRVFEMGLNDIRVVILGQDPYANDYADGLAFSVKPNCKIPGSLKNIFKEIQLEFPERKYNFVSGDLSKWSESGIFLLNCSLTVEPGRSGSHMKRWKSFTDSIIKLISTNNKNVVFLLLGNFAQTKSLLISDKSRIIKGVHPSPNSAWNGFFNSGIFKQVELLLNETIDWTN
jgi:uracil-DNA glycosylase